MSKNVLNGSSTFVFLWRLEGEIRRAVSKGFAAFRSKRLSCRMQRPSRWPRFSSQLAPLFYEARMSLQHCSFVSQVAPRYGDFRTHWGRRLAISGAAIIVLGGLPPSNLHRKCLSSPFAVSSDVTTPLWTPEVRGRRSWFIGSRQAIRGNRGEERGSPWSVESSEFISI